MELKEIQDILMKGNNLSMQYKERKSQKATLTAHVENLEYKKQQIAEELDKQRRACMLISQLSDNTMMEMLNSIKDVINKAMGVIFKDNIRSIDIVPELYKNEYPHFIVKLYTANGTERSFRQNGAGLSQIVSFLATICMIDAKGCRKVLVMDEILNGVHPEALECIYTIMKSVEDRFQFVCVEYGFDIGKQILVENKNDTAKVTELTEPYYVNCYAELSSTVS